MHIVDPMEAETPIEIVEYDPSWPTAYREEVDRLRSVVGQITVGFAHIGSTAVPELPAKDIVDVLAGVNDITDVDPYVDQLTDLGYTFYPSSRSVESRDWRYFERRDEGQWVNLHFMPADSEAVHRDLLFREYLRDHPDVAERYAELKHELAASHPTDVEAYSTGKSAFVADVIERAEAAGYDPSLETV